MDLFFGLVGFVGFVVFLTLGVVASIKKNGKAKPHFLFMGICFVLFVIGLALPGSEVPVEDETASATVEKKEEPKKDVKSDEEKKAEAEAKKKEEEAKSAEEAKKKEEEAKKKAAEEKKAKEEAEMKRKAKEISEYADNVIGALTPLRDDMYTFADLNSKASQDPTLIMTQDWTLDMAGTLMSMQEGIKNVKSIENVPDNMVKSHDLMMKSMDEYQFVVDNYPTAVDNLDADLMMECVTHMQQGQQYLEDSNKELETLTGESL
jgi:flagellar biosynthesis GTPase FlhF